MKTITICGSLKFQKEMMITAEKLTLMGNLVITPIFPANHKKDSYSISEIETLGKMHKEKINISDAICVINVGGYIGQSTKSEIEYAKRLNKEIVYYTDIK